MNKLPVCLALFLGLWALPPASSASVFVSINIAPPPLPIYVQPEPPADDFLWIPGYWAYDEDGYFWVPGTWVLAPQPGFLWTPGYWAWDGGLYYWRRGYWGPSVGFYGGVNYGYGYFGSGYYGGHWDHDHFYYNRAVTNVNVTVIHNTYNQRVAEHDHDAPAHRISYNGGNGGITARPSKRDRENEREKFAQPTADQVQHEQGARGHRELRAAENNGNPPVAATPRPGAFSDRGAQPAKHDKDAGPGPSKREGAARENKRNGDTEAPPARQRRDDSGKRDAPREGPPAGDEPPSRPQRQERQERQKREPQQRSRPESAPPERETEPAQAPDGRESGPPEREPGKARPRGKRSKEDKRQDERKD